MCKKQGYLNYLILFVIKPSGIMMVQSYNCLYINLILNIELKFYVLFLLLQHIINCYEDMKKYK